VFDLFEQKKVWKTLCGGKKVLVRCDFNVPIKMFVITNDNRIQAAPENHSLLMDHKAK
jgi:phosphoglycerate kinase